MTHTSDISYTAENKNDAIAAAWVGPALGSAILTVAWALYLVPLLIGILSIR